jgi:hypothetical protein
LKTSVRGILLEKGPCLTSKLVQVMMERGVSSDAARKRVERAVGVKRLSGIRFEKNAKFIYCDEQYGDHKFWTALEAAFKTSGKSYWGAFIGIKQRGGACPKSLFPRVCGAPDRRIRQLSPEVLLKRLSNIHLVKEVHDDKMGEPWISFNPNCYTVEAPSPEHRAILIAENILIGAIADWAKKLGFGSYGKFALRNDSVSPVVSGVTWDITAPSYVRPLVSVPNGRIKPGFFVCDVCLGHQVTDEEVELFIRKYDMAASPRNIAPILGFFVADGFVQSAYDKAKAAGIIATTISHLFGDEITKALNDLIKLLSDTGRTAAINPEHLANVMNRLSKIEGASANLRGSLFELVVGNLLAASTGGYLKTGFKIGRVAELDAFVDIADEERSIIVECKAKVPGSMVSEDDVKHWYDNRIPFINKTLREQPLYTNRKLEFEIWTNGTFHPSAIEWLEQKETKFDKYSVAWRDGIYIKEYSKNDGVTKHIRDILREHYFKNPLQ